MNRALSSAAWDKDHGKEALMGKFDILLPSMLTLFDGGDGGDGGGMAGTQASGGSQPGAGGEPVVLYGKQADDGSDAESAETTPKPETHKDKMARFRELVDGEFKDIYTQETQRIINKKVRENKTLQEQLGKYQPVLDTLMARYGINDGDIAKLQSAIDSDSAYWSAAAEEAGMTESQYKELLRLRNIDAKYNRMRLGMQAQEAARNQMRQWLSEAEELKKDYPDFDLERFVADPQNLEYLKARAPMRMIYEYANRDKIQYDVAAQTERSVVENIRAKGARPKENGAAPKPAVTVKKNVDELTNADIDEIMRRVQRGETISF